VAFGLAVAEVKADDVFDLAPFGSAAMRSPSWLKKRRRPWAYVNGRPGAQPAVRPQWA